ncbi:hypothetical protein Catovirus_1_327 [Catovirus CTV1]|uniref:Uncharacterized protein n=1 Tax=Catovirus CTV1 TaxID=1977631 RepID=A0A1V0S987_9VIRU|nr:hypothetical protein Catovirus_1_327 [Catovirus CTV1]
MSKNNLYWLNKNLNVKDCGKIVDVFQNCINLLGENSFGSVYLCVNVFDETNIKIEYLEKNGVYEILFNGKIIDNADNRYKFVYDFVAYCKYLVTTCDNNNVDDDHKFLLFKKYSLLNKA